MHFYKVPQLLWKSFGLYVSCIYSLIDSEPDNSLGIVYLFCLSPQVLCLCMSLQVSVCVYVSRSSSSTCSHVVVSCHAPVCCHTLSGLLLANGFTVLSPADSHPHYLRLTLVHITGVPTN